MQPVSWAERMNEQWGLLSRAQALELALTRHQIDTLLLRGTWVASHPGVYRAAGASTHWPHAAMAASLWAGERTAISHRTAARLWDFDAYREETAVEFTSRRVLRPPPGVVFHRTRNLMRSEVTEVPGYSGMTVTTVARTLFDLFSEWPRKTERTLDEALRRKLVTGGELEHVLALNGVRGRKGASAFAQLVADRVQKGHTDSALETDALERIRKAGLPAPERQFFVLENERFVARVDFAWPSKRVAVQVHGGTIHRQKKTWERDLVTENALHRAGWKVIKVSRALLSDHAAELVATLAGALGEPQAEGRPPARAGA